MITPIGRFSVVDGEMKGEEVWPTFLSSLSQKRLTSKRDLGENEFQF